jgi:hypothetical protein
MISSNNVSVDFFNLFTPYTELDLELAESTLMSKMERRKEFVNNMQ